MKEGKTIYHIDRVLQETGDVADNGFYKIYVNMEIDDNSDIAEGIPLLSIEEIIEPQDYVLQIL